MTEEAERPSSEEAPLDLESLRDLDFGPRWSSGSGKSASRERGSSSRGGGRESAAGDGRSSPAGRDRRPARKRPAGARESGRARPEPVERVVAFTIYPEDEPFDLLVQSIRSSLKVHELFELTRLILEKPDRMVVVVHPLSEEAPPLAQSIPDGKLYLNREPALAHAAQQVLSSYFEVREEEVDPPSGNFPSVLRCRKTQALLPPRNYHLYAALLREHQRRRLPEMSVEAVERQLEPIADEAVIQEWVDSMSRRSTYVLRPVKGEESAEPTMFPDREKALQYLMRTRREALVRESRSVRLSAKELLEHEEPAIAGSFRDYVEEQKRFPLESSHQVRAKLRKARMQLFKQGRKGITYVSAVRRKHRPAGQRFADSVERILATLEQAGRTMTVRELAAQFFPEAVDGEIPAEEKKRLAQDLLWLKSEGYLLEYASGALELQPVEKGTSPSSPEAKAPAASMREGASDAAKVSAGSRPASTADVADGSEGEAPPSPAQASLSPADVGGELPAGPTASVPGPKSPTGSAPTSSGPAAPATDGGADTRVVAGRGESAESPPQSPMSPSPTLLSKPGSAPSQSAETKPSPQTVPEADPPERG